MGTSDVVGWDLGGNRLLRLLVDWLLRLLRLLVDWLLVDRLLVDGLGVDWLLDWLLVDWLLVDLLVLLDWLLIDRLLVGDVLDLLLLLISTSELLADATALEETGATEAAKSTKTTSEAKLRC